MASDRPTRDRARSTTLGPLVAYLRPERARLGALSAVLVVAMLAPVAGPLLLGDAIDEALQGGAAVDVVVPAATFLAVTLGGDLLQVLVTWWSVRLAWRVGNRLRLDLARHALGLDLEWHSRHSPGLLIERLDGDIEAIVKFSSTAVLQLFGNAILLAGVLAVSIAVDWRAGALIAASAAAAVLLIIRLRAVAVPAHDAEREVQARLYGDLEERLGGLEDIRGNGAGDYAVHRLTEHSSRWWHAARRAALSDGAYAVAGSASTVGTVLTLGLGVWLNRQGQLSIGATLALFRYSQMIREPVERMAEQIREMQKAAAGARRAARLLATRATIVDGRGTPLPAGPLAVDLDGVTLVYDSGKVALDGVDLYLDPGTRLGVVGRTGSGKTSLGRVLTRLWDATEGTVRLGGVDVRDTTDDELRRRIAVVSQDVELLDAPLRDNLTFFGALDAGDDAVWDVLDEVGLGPWAAGLPDGLDTRLDARALSAGEAQLIALARVLLSDAGLVLLDEATSRLDPATEATLAAATERALAGRTAVIIAHRLSTLDEVDEICVVHGGRIVEHDLRTTLAGDHRSHFAGLLGAAAPTGRLAS
jgi:ABC-type multidrug transport system fused ATPase/permease subunit